MVIKKIDWWGYKWIVSVDKYSINQKASDIYDNGKSRPNYGLLFVLICHRRLQQILARAMK